MLNPLRMRRILVLAVVSLLGCGDGPPDGSLSTSKDLVSFSVLSTSAAPSGSSVSLTLPHGTDLTSLVPTVVHTGASVSPESGVAQDFTGTVTYTVTAEDGSKQEYAVTIATAPGDAKSIEAFSINGVGGVITGTEIAVVLPSGIDLSALSPLIVFSGVSIDPASGAAHDFSAPVDYTVTAADGSTQRYTVTVTVAPSDQKDLSSFAIDGATGVIHGTAIQVVLPMGTDVRALVPTLTHTGLSVSPQSGTAQDFTAPVQYVVTAEDGTTRTYTVTVTVPSSDQKDIVTFSINGVAGVINGTAIAIALPEGTNPSSLAPTISHTGASISPASGSARNFTSPVQYVVTAANGSTRTYTVTVTVVSSDKELTRFVIGPATGVISGSNVSVTMPLGSTVTALTPTIQHTGASVSPASGATRDFTTPVQYTTTATDGSTRTYLVTVTVATASTNQLLAVEVDGIPGVIDHVESPTGSVDLNLPEGTNLAAVAPRIDHNGVSVTPGSEVAQNFTNGPVLYRVTGANGVERQYQITARTGALQAPKVAIVPVGQTSNLGITLIDYVGAPVPSGTYALTNNAPTVFSVTSVGVVSGLTQGFGSLGISSAGRASVTTWIAVRPLVNFAVGSTTSGSIAASDGFAAFGSSEGLPSSSYYADVYRFSLEAGTTVEFVVDTGDNLDSYLLLANGLGVLVAGNDDDDDGVLGVGSRLRFAVPTSGTYDLEVSTFNGLDTGNYQLSVTLSGGAP